MTNAKITEIPTANKPDENYVDDPKIVKIAMLSLILTDKNTDFEIKRLSVMAALRMNYITEEEANQLLLYRVELEDYRKHEDEDLSS
jgi:hypothetical protein